MAIPSVAGAAAMLLWLTTSAAAQTAGTGSLRGHVLDEQKAFLPGVTVVATSVDGTDVFTTLSDDRGAYRLNGLPPGTYSLTAELSGWARYERSGIVIRAGLNIGADIQMQLGVITETIQVVVDTPMLEVERPGQAVNIDGDFQRTVPLTGRRDFTDFLALTPGLNRFAATDTGGGLYQLRGSNLESHVTMVDGADYTSLRQGRPDYTNLSTDSISDVQVKAAVSDASAPLGVGVVINVASPSGTNTLKGALGFVYTARQWNADNNPEGDTNSTDLFQPDGSLGGPIVADKAWFFTSLRHTRRQVGILRDSTRLEYLQALVPGFEPFDNQTNGTTYFIKPTIRLGDNHRLEATYNFDHYPIETNRSEHSTNVIVQGYGGSGYGARLNSVWGRLFTSELVVSFNNKTLNGKRSVFDRYIGDTPSRPVHDGVFLSSGRLMGTGLVVELGDTASRFVAPADKLTVSSSATVYLTDFAGAHEVQLGAHLQPRLNQDVDTIYSNLGFALEEVVLRDPLNPAAGFLPFHRRHFSIPELRTQSMRAQDYGLFVQDNWKPVGRLTINAGVRFDLIRIRDGLVDITTQRSVEVGPRFGATYVLTADRRNVLYSSWGRVADLINSIFVPAASSATPSFTDSYDNNLDGTFETTLVTPGATRELRDRRLDPDLHQPFIDEWTAGYRRQLPGQVSVDASFVRRTYKDRPALVEVNGIYDAGVFRGYRDESLNQIFLATNNRWNSFVYSGLEVLTTKRTSRVQLIGAYTRAWRHLSGTWQPNDPASFIQPEAFQNNRGLGTRGNTTNSLSGNADGFGNNGWTDHTGRLGVVYRGHSDWVVAANFQIQAGWYSGPIVKRIQAPDPSFGPPTVRLSNGRVVSNPLATVFRFVGATRSDGQLKAPVKYDLSFRVARVLRLRGLQIEPGLDVFNLTNHDGYERFRAGDAQQIQSPNYGKPDALQAPRAAQLSLRLRF